MMPPRALVAPALVAGVTVVLALGTLCLVVVNGRGPRGFIAENQAPTWLAGLCLGLVGALVLRDRPGNRLGPLTAAVGIAASLGALGYEYATYGLAAPTPPTGTAVAAWCASTLWIPGFLVLIAGLPLLFPAGRLASPRWRWPGALALVSGSAAFLAFATSQYALDDSGFGQATNPLDLPLDDDVNVVVTGSGFALTFLVGVAATVAVAVRMRRAEGQLRQQYAWFLAAVCLGGVFLLLPAPDLVSLLLNVGCFAALAVGIVRHGLFDIEVALSRSVVYALLTTVVVAVYLAAVALLGARVEGGLAPVLVTALAALLLAGARQRVQSWVDHAMYGERGDRAAALTTLGQRLGAALDDEQVLPVTAAAVRDTLRLPYVELRLAGEEGPGWIAGTRPERTVELALTHAGADVGVLVVGLRRGEAALSAGDARLLDAFGRQAGVAAHGVRATRELRRSREHIVASREEERRRIRRDLHDGLGPALAGISLGLETASRAVGRDPSGAAQLMTVLRADTSACVDEVRRIVFDLRPPALDEGLLPALSRHADLLTGHSGGALTVSVQDVAPLPRLTPAVEVAAYRIATEAMTNTVRHAHASWCRVVVRHDGEVHLEVTDDGTGTPPDAPGTGLTSMRDRAEELGGRCTVTFRPGRGTRVDATLPGGAAAS